MRPALTDEPERKYTWRCSLHLDGSNTLYILPYRRRGTGTPLPAKLATATDLDPEARTAMTAYNVTAWIRLHWFELATLALLSLNLWLAYEVLSVLKAGNQAMVHLGNSLNRTRDGSLPAETLGAGLSIPVLMRAAHPVLITVALAALSWALLVALLVGIAAAIWAVL